MARPPRKVCPWCDEARMWPDLCTIDGPLEADGRPMQGEDWCADIVDEHHEAWGDHRRCHAGHCDVAARWFAEVRSVAKQVCEENGKTYAVISIVADMLNVVGVEDHFGRAKSNLRTRFLKSVGLPIDYSGKGLVYVVRGEDGGIF